MDPVSLIVAALMAGALAGMQNTATDAIKDSYAGLKRLVGRRVAGRPPAEIALQQIELKPEDWQGALTSELAELNVGDDHELVAAARQLVNLLNGAGLSSGTISVYASHSTGLQVGNWNHQENDNRVIQSVRPFREDPDCDNPRRDL